MTTESYITTPDNSPEAEIVTESMHTTLEPETEHSEAPTTTSTTTTEQPMAGEEFSAGIIVVGGFEAGVEETDMCYWEGDLWICMPNPMSIIIGSELRS